MKRFLLAAALIVLLPFLAVAEDANKNATGDGWTKVTLPANGGFVLSLELPPGWEHGFQGSTDASGYYAINDERPQWLSVFYHHPDHFNAIVLYMFTYSNPFSLEDFAKVSRLKIQFDTTLHIGSDQSFGRPSFSHTKSYEKGATDPHRRDVATVFHDRVGIFAFFYRWHPNTIADLSKDFDTIIKKITVTPVADLDPTEVWQLYVSPKIGATPGKFWLNAEFSLAMPPGWQAEEVEVVRVASGGAEAGRMIVDFFPPGASDEASFTVQLDGMPYNRSLSAAEFLATRDPIVASMADDAREVETATDVGMPDAERRRPDYSYATQDGFCLSESSTRRFHQTEGVKVKSYAGKDALTGKDTKLRIYTAGGVTLACNLIFRAPPDDFDRLAPQVGEMVRSIKTTAGGLIMLK